MEPAAPACTIAAVVMKRYLRYIGRYFSFFMLVVCGLMAYSNVVADDTEVRKLALTTLGDFAGCKDKCALSGMHGERGMVHETIEYDIDGKGHYVVKCHRKMVALGDYLCVVTDGAPAGGSAAGASSTPASSATPRPSH